MVTRSLWSRRVVQRSIAAWLLLTAGCGTADFVGPPDSSANIPAVGMSRGEFGFAVTARRWTSDQTYHPEMTSDALEVGLAIIGYAGGTGTITVTDADGAAVFARDLAGNVAQGSTVVHGRAPFHVRVVATGYTGVIALGVSAEASSD